MSAQKVIEAKIPPQNVDAEKSLIGAVLIDEDVLADASEIVTARDFYDKRHVMIYDAMLRLFEHHKPVDLLTLTDELKKKKHLEDIGGTAYLTELTNYVPTAAHAATYAEMVAQNCFPSAIKTPDKTLRAWSKSCWQVLTAWRNCTATKARSAV
jgi:replicative DNA helicase